jgi:hypothetical protein
MIVMKKLICRIFGHIKVHNISTKDGRFSIQTAAESKAAPPKYKWCSYCGKSFDHELDHLKNAPYTT